MTKKLTRAKAMEAMCKHCIYDPADKGTWREQVQACTSPACPLFEWRPLPTKKSKGGPVPPGIQKYRDQLKLQQKD